MANRTQEKATRTQGKARQGKVSVMIQDKENKSYYPFPRTTLDK